MDHRTIFVLDSVAQATACYEELALNNFNWCREGVMVYPFRIYSGIDNETFYAGSPRRPPVKLRFMRGAWEIMYEVELSPGKPIRQFGRQRLVTTTTFDDCRTDKERNCVMCMIRHFHLGLHEIVGPFRKIITLSKISSSRARVEARERFDQDEIQRSYEDLLEIISRDD